MKAYVKPQLEYIELTVNERLAGTCIEAPTPDPTHGTCWS